MSSLARVTLGIPTHHRAAYLADAIRSGLL
jgi:hypothetical protein